MPITLAYRAGYLNYVAEYALIYSQPDLGRFLFCQLSIGRIILGHDFICLLQPAFI